MANNKSNTLESFLLGDDGQTQFGGRLISRKIDTDHHVSIRGLERTSESVVRRCFANLRHAHTLSQLKQELDRSLLMCRHIGLKSVDIALDADESRQILVDVHCTEKNPYAFKAGVTMESQRRDVQFSTTAMMRDLVHRAETWGLSMETGKDWRKSLSVSSFVDVPQVFPSHEHAGNVRLNVDLFGQNPMFTSYLRQKVLGFSIFSQINKRHSIAYGFSKRNMERVTPGAGMFSFGGKSKDDNAADTAATQQQEEVDLSGLASEYKAEDSVSKLTHRFENNNIRVGYEGSSPFEFMSGGRVMANTELALLGGSTQYILSEMALDYYLPLLKKYGIVAHLHTEVGAAASMDDPNDNSKVTLAERFYESSRGWTKYLGDYDSASNSPLGGNVKANILARLAFPFPIRAVYELFGVNGHVFFQTSNADRVNFKGVQLDSFTDKFWRNMYSSAGLGLCLNLGGMGRLEFNYSMPVKTGDRYAAEGDFKKMSLFFEMQK